MLGREKKCLYLCLYISVNLVFKKVVNIQESLMFCILDVLWNLTLPWLSVG